MLSWTQVEGHARVKDVLERSVASERLHHALLFTGPSGVGKRALALALAASVNCTRREVGVWASACGECPSCRKIDQSIHPDLMLLEPQGKKNKTLKIEQIRGIHKATHARPYEARERVVIIDDAHLMTEEASNALLKTLEEPSASTRLILVTDAPHMLLDTILSRCQRIRFGALTREQVTRLLGVIAVNDPDLKGSGAALLDVAAGYGEGSVGRAREVLSTGLLSGRQELVDELVGLERGHPRALLELAEQLKKSDDLNAQLDILKVFLRDVMLFQVVGEGAGIVNSDLLALVRRWSDKMHADRAISSIEAINEAQELLGRNVNGQLVMEKMLRALRASPHEQATR